MANATSTQLQELYVAYFGRAADPTGLAYWTEKGITTKAFAANMYAQPEFETAYGSLSVEAQVNQIYKNLFDREADVTGLTYWTQQINLGNLVLAEIAVDLIWAAKNNTGSSDDKTALTNRTNAAVAYTAKVKESTSAILAYAPTSSDPWTAGDNITEAVNYMSGIDKDTPSTTAGIASSVTTIVNNGTQTGKKSFTLTTGVNTFTGGDSADTFDATTSLSLNTGDVLKGGGGNDTLTAKILEIKDEKIRFSKRALEKDPFDWFKNNNKKVGDVITTRINEVLKTGVKVTIDKDKNLIVTIKKSELAKDSADARPDVFSQGNALDAKITELDMLNRRVKLSVKAAQIDEEKSLIAKFGEGATKSGATLKGIFEKAIGKKNKKEK